ncbi:MAG: hypothetical protein GX902_05255 [Lentisphaerae bacterium]|nr:hypothetical protein [Lentisphaerota bacterium]
MEEKQVLVGWSRRDVSTDQPVGIRGQFYLRLSEKVKDPVMVTALTLDNGEDAAIFLSIDGVGIQADIVRRIREAVRQKDSGLPSEKIIFNVTHAHTGGDLYTAPDDFPCELPRMSGADYQVFFVEQSALAIVESWQTRQPGQLAWGFGYATTGCSRRVVYFDDTSQRPDAAQKPGLMVNGHAVMYGNTNDTQFSHFEAGADPYVHLLYTFTPAGKLTGAVVNVPCPSQCSMHEWNLTADFWHEVRQNIREQYGEEVFILPQCAAAGDLETINLHCKAALKRRLELKGSTQRQEIAERICAAFSEVLTWAGKDRRDKVVLGHRVRTVQLSRQRISQEVYEQECANLARLQEQEFVLEGGTARERLITNSRLSAQRNRCRRVIERYKSQDAEPKLPMELHVLRVGDIAFASNRFELYMDFMHRIQARSPALQTFIIQLAGSEVGSGGGSYLATRRGVAGKGYSATQYCNLVSPEGGQELVEETLADLHALWG